MYFLFTFFFSLPMIWLVRKMMIMVMLQVCKTHYETTCETRFKEHEVEQDEPVCKMVTERKCKDVRGE